MQQETAKFQSWNKPSSATRLFHPGFHCMRASRPSRGSKFHSHKRGTTDLCPLHHMQLAIPTGRGPLCCWSAIGVPGMVRRSPALRRMHPNLSLPEHQEACETLPCIAVGLCHTAWCCDMTATCKFVGCNPPKVHIMDGDYALLPI